VIVPLVAGSKTVCNSLIVSGGIVFILQNQLVVSLQHGHQMSSQIAQPIRLAIPKVATMPTRVSTSNP